MDEAVICGENRGKLLKAVNEFACSQSGRSLKYTRTVCLFDRNERHNDCWMIGTFSNFILRHAKETRECSVQT